MRKEPRRSHRPWRISCRRARKPAAKAKKTANAGTKPKSPPKAGAKAKPGASEAKPIKARKGEKVAVVLLSGGNPQIAKADGDAPVQAYIAAMPGWKRDLGKRLDALIVRNVPNVRKAVKWNSPFYGIEGQGWFLSFHVFTHYIKVTFFRGTSLRPVPPGASKHKDVRYFDIREGDELDEAQMATWVRQAAALPAGFPSRHRCDGGGTTRGRGGVSAVPTGDLLDNRRLPCWSERWRCSSGHIDCIEHGACTRDTNWKAGRKCLTRADGAGFADPVRYIGTIGATFEVGAVFTSMNLAPSMIHIP